jgi:predicted polyphosphate/ATP-dependent NAD kinase
MRDNPRPVGIIANPQSGKDIRRISAYGFVANNHEKVNVIQKVLLGLDSAGITEVFYMPEAFGIVPRAAESLALSLAVMPVDLEPGYTAEDSTCAARLMEEIGAGCIVTLGGDGTNRAVFKGVR